MIAPPANTQIWIAAGVTDRCLLKHPNSSLPILSSICRCGRIPIDNVCKKSKTFRDRSLEGSLQFLKLTKYDYFFVLLLNRCKRTQHPSHLW
jgi:hypothetical protein